jgi:hypothetical protein
VAGTFDERPDDFSTVAFWYQTPFRTDLPDLPTGYERLPYGNTLLLEAEDRFDDAVTVNGAKELLDWSMARQRVILFPGEGAGARLTLPFSVPENGRYEILAMCTGGPDYGIYAAEVDGAAIGEVLEPYSTIVPEAGAKETGESFDFWAKHPSMTRGCVLGRFDLDAGDHEVAWICSGRNALSTGHKLGVDSLVLSRVHPSVDRG